MLLFTPLLYHATLFSQCISDVYYLEDSPESCHFVGTVDFENSDCVDFFQSDWRYLWRISGADDGDLIAVYEGMAFDHVFEKFGGYDFCLEIYKSGSTELPPDLIECVTYTTCEPCGGAEIGFEYQSCPIGEGCNLKFEAKIPAVNMVGLEPTGKYIVTYHPSDPELLGGIQSFEIDFDDVEIEFHPDSGYISVSEDLYVKFMRGCFTPRLEMELIYGAGAHSSYGGPPCTDVALVSEDIFRCIACNEGGFGCTASIMATDLAKNDSTCTLFACPIETASRSTDFDTDPQEKSIHSFFQVSPNPARTSVRVEVSEMHDNMTINLFDAWGRVVAEKNPHGLNSTDFDVSNFSPGIYLVVVRANGKVIHSEKLTIVR